jgi:hypothetical protein
MSHTPKTKKKLPPEEVERIFGDFDARARLVGFYELAYKVDQRVNPHLYDGSPPCPTDDHD